MSVFGPVEPLFLVPLEDNNGEAIWRRVASRIAHRASQDQCRALFTYQEDSPLPWILKFVNGREDLRFAISTPLNKKQVQLLVLLQTARWNDLAVEDLSFLFSDFWTYNFLLEKKKVRRREKNRRKQWRKRVFLKSSRRSPSRPRPARLVASQRLPPPDHASSQMRRGNDGRGNHYRASYRPVSMAKSGSFGAFWWFQPHLSTVSAVAIQP